MSDVTFDAAAARPATGVLYRAFWRWHFFAGLLVLPFMISLAVTGGLYLFQDEIEAVVHRSTLVVAASSVPPLTSSAIVEKALAAQPGTPIRYVPPASPTSSAEVGIKTEAGIKTSLWLDPHDGRVLGQTDDRSKLMWVIRKIHSLEYFGTIANGVIELVAGWAIILALTGIFLWWPRGRDGGVITVRGTSRQRVFWRDLHAVVGVFAAVFVLFLALTGLPWSVFWGAHANEWATGAGVGYPTVMWDDVPKSTVPSKDALEKTGWVLENAPMVKSAGPAGAPIGLDAAVAFFDATGIHRGYSIDLPGKDPEGVYTASVWPKKVADERLIHLDQYSGKPLVDVRFADYGGVGKVFEWAINVHMGKEFGLINQLVLLAACVSIVLLAISAAVMWWKRRPKGALAAPRRLPDDRVGFAVIGVIVVLGVFMPLVGASILIALAIDLTGIAISKLRAA